MIFKSISDMIPLQSIDGSEFLLARKENKDYSLPVSTLLNKSSITNTVTLSDGVSAYAIKNNNGNLFLQEGETKIGDLITNEKSFQNDTFLHFQQIMCPGIYNSWKQGFSEDANANLQFTIALPNLIDIKTNNNNLYLNNLALRIRTSYGTAVLVSGNTFESATFTNISDEVSIIENGSVINSGILDRTVTEIFVNSPNQLRIRVFFYNNLRYIDPVFDSETYAWEIPTPNATNTSNKLVTPNTACTVTITGDIGYRTSLD